MKKEKFLFFISCFISFSFAEAQSATTQPAGAGACVPSAACLACPGSTWNNEMNITVADGAGADVDLNPFGSCFQSSCYYSRFLSGSQFGFSIPGTATILGVEVSIIRRGPSANIIKDSSLRIWQNGTVSSLNYAAMLTAWPSQYDTAVYGGPTDLWGLSWTPADLNNAATSVYLRALSTSGVAVTGVSVDNISMTVYFSTTSGVVQSQNAVPGSFTIKQVNENTLIASYSCVKNDMGSVKLYDITGKQVDVRSGAVELNGNQCTELLHISSLQPGIYFAQLYTRQKMLSKKIIIQK